MTPENRSPGFGMRTPFRVTLSRTSVTTIMGNSYDDASGTGSGHVETILFDNDSNVDFARVQTLVP